MRATRKTTLILFTLISCIILGMMVNAVDITPVSFSLESEAVTDKILEDGVAEFQLTINNLQDEADTFRILPLEDLKWTPQFVPTTARTQKISGKNSDTLTMLVKPSEVPRGSYNVKVTVESENTGTRYNAVLKIHVGPHPSMYNPDVSVKVSVPARLDPNQQYDVKVTLTNNNIIDLGNVHVSTTGKFIDNEQEVMLGPEEVKVVSVAIQLPEDTEPQTGDIAIKVTYLDDTTFYDSTHAIEVMEFLPPFAQNISVDKGFLKTKKTIILKNDGNTKKDSPVKLETNRRLNLFTRTDPTADVVEEGERMYHVWQVSLDPEESTTITVTTSYRWFFFLILVLIIAYIVYWFMKAPIVVSKQYKDVSYDEGSIADAKIVMHVKNRSSRPVKNVHIIERLPHVIGIKKGAFKHTLEPKKAYKHGKEGTVLEYDIPVLDPKEERLITYAIKSKMQVIGGLTIKPTIVKYKGKSGHTEKAVSNETTIPGLE
ncbi:hypothetical protein ACFL96_07885 [Thermoproteota archaeon]